MQGGKFFTGLASPGFAHMIINKPVSTIFLTKDDLLKLQSNVYDIINDPLKKKYSTV